MQPEPAPLRQGELQTAGFLTTTGLLALLAGSTLSARKVSIGVIGGSSATGDFRTLRYSRPDFTEISESGSPSLIVGPTFEIALPRNWSIEVDALHRTLRYKVRTDRPGGDVCPPGNFCGGSVSTWQFPVLLKYTLPVSRWRPFLEAGPSFRTHSNPIGSRPSSYGITAGAGFDVPLGHFYLAPTVRYTHWGEDGLPFRPTVRNQVELLAAFGYRTDNDLPRLRGRKVWFGVIAGVPLTNDFPPSRGGPTYSGEAKRVADFRSAAGLMTELTISRDLSVEVNGLYRRLHFENAPEVVVTWEIPVLAKYTFAQAPLRPFLEAGPSFRVTGNLNYTDPAHFGTSAGAGMEARWRRLRITPTLRYTRWAKDGQVRAASQTFTKRDQVELLFGFSF